VLVASDIQASTPLVLTATYEQTAAINPSYVASRCCMRTEKNQGVVAFEPRTSPPYKRNSNIIVLTGMVQPVFQFRSKIYHLMR
jgi:hypothetical protein